MIRKQFSNLVAVIVLVSLFSSCSSHDPEKYYSEKDDFSIKFPTQWENKEGFMGTSVISLSPLENSEDQFRENVNVVVEQLPVAMDLEQYYTTSATNLRKFITDCQEFESGNTSINETDAKWLVYSGRMGTLNLKNKVYCMVRDNRGYVITCSAAPDDFTRYTSRFEEIAQSFAFE